MPVTAAPKGAFTGTPDFWQQARNGLGRNSNALIGYGLGMLSGAKGAELQGYMQGSQTDDAYATSKKEEATRQAQLNKTIEYLRKVAPQYVGAVEAGAMTPYDAYNQFLSDSKPKPRNLMSVAPGAIVIDEATGESVFTGAPDPKDALAASNAAFGNEKDLAAQYANADPIKTYTVVRDSYERVRQSAAQNTGAGDMGLIYGYMKMLDPGSVVRESEFAMAAAAGSFGEQIQGLVTRIVNGERLPESQRQEFVRSAEVLYQESAANAQAVNDQFSTRAGEWNVDPTRFVRPVESYKPFAPATTGVVDMGGGVTIRPIP